MSDEGFLSRWSRRKVEVKKGGAVSDDRPHPSPLPQREREQPGEGRVAEEGLREPQQPEANRLPAQAPSNLPTQTPSLAPPGRGIEGEGPAPTGPVEEATPPPTMADVAALTPTSDFTPFLTRNVDESVKRAALKTLFTDPHFNVMDGLDTYIDDYSQPDPIPEAMLRRMTQSHFLGLFDDEEKTPDEQTGPKASPDGDAGAGMTQSTPDHQAVPIDEDPDLRLQQDDAAGPGGTGEGPPA